MPPALAARQEIEPWLRVYIEAFSLLSAGRTGGTRPIRLAEIESYCHLFGWDEPEEVADLVEILRAMDAVYLEVATRRADRGVQSGMPNSAKGRRGA